MRVWAAAALLLVLAACSPPEVACTEIASPSGVGVTVAAPYAEQVDELRLEVCWSGRCTEGTVALGPGSDTVDSGCSGPRPEDTCSATAVPNGTRVGFLPAELPAGEVTISGTVTVGGRAETLAGLTRSAEPTYPNGPRCGPGGNQVAVTLDRTGIR